jgi:hypothetical protein
MLLDRTGRALLALTTAVALLSGWLLAPGDTRAARGMELATAG